MMPEMIESVDLIRPADRRLISRGIDCILSEAESPCRRTTHELIERRRSFDDYCLMHRLDTTRQVLAMRGERIIAACLWVPTAGRTALFYTPQTAPRDVLAQASQVQCIMAAGMDARAAGMALAQVILTPDAEETAELYRRADFSDLATLLYMRRNRPLFKPSFELPPDFQLETYTPHRRGQFGQAIESSYIQTLDCPRLSGLRPMEDVIAGHQASAFDPSLWFLLTRNGQNAGVLLMSHRRETAALELVYLGLVPSCRQMRLGSQLMKLVLQTAIQLQTAGIILAVDRANTPAVHLYRSLRFAQTAERQVLIHPFSDSACPPTTSMHAQ
jgi:ribosomal protein S18 acetylase RimI-like enzyme